MFDEHHGLLACVHESITLEWIPMLEFSLTLGFQCEQNSILFQIHSQNNKEKYLWQKKIEIVCKWCGINHHKFALQVCQFFYYNTNLTPRFCSHGNLLWTFTHVKPSHVWYWVHIITFKGHGLLLPYCLCFFKLIFWIS